jgi:hypothetical protein
MQRDVKIAYGVIKSVQLVKGEGAPVVRVREQAWRQQSRCNRLGAKLDQGLRLGVFRKAQSGRSLRRRPIAR